MLNACTSLKLFSPETHNHNYPDKKYKQKVLSNVNDKKTKELFN